MDVFFFISTFIEFHSIMSSTASDIDLITFCQGWRFKSSLFKSLIVLINIILFSIAVIVVFILHHA